MKFIVAIITAVILTVAGTASAQDQESQGSQIYYPGSLWTSVGNLSPAEKGNVMAIGNLEQGIAYRGAELYGIFQGQWDTKGFDWDRRVKTGVGVRFTQSVKNGMIRAGVAWIEEKRFVTGNRGRGVQVSVDTWFGWSQRPRVPQQPRSTTTLTEAR